MKPAPIVFALLILSSAAFAQLPPRDWYPQSLDQLGQSATSRTEFSYDHSMLVMKAKTDDEDPNLLRVVAGVDGISIHRFHFQDGGMYDPRILSEVRHQYRGSGWQHLSKAHVRQDNPGETDLWVRYEHNTIRNVALLFAGRNQVNFITVSGSFSPLELLHLSGHFGIPKIEGGVVVQDPAAQQQAPPPADQGGPPPAENNNGY